MLSPQSKIHIRSLRDQLRGLKKDSSQSMTDYLLHAKTLSDSLLAASATLPESDIIDFITDGLGSKFKEFITSLHFKPNVDFDDLFDLLLQEEQLIYEAHGDLFH